MIRCLTCHRENIERAKFCEECGTTLFRHCPTCQHTVSPRVKFCPECGTRLSKVPPPTLQRARSTNQPAQPEPLSTVRNVPETERRQLTIMFCDVVGSTALSERLDPEDLLEVVLAYQEVCAAVIRRFDGHIAQYLGDGLLVYFGYPHAHEDAPQRAIRTGLSIVDALNQLNTRLECEQGLRLAIRLQNRWISVPCFIIE